MEHAALPDTATVPVPHVAERRRVVDAPTRAGHALLALAFALAYLTGELDGARALHVTLGWTVAGLLAFRVVDGLVGPPHRRLRALLGLAAGLPAWLRAMRSRPSLEPAAWRPLYPAAMATTVVALLATAVPVVSAGWLAWIGFGGERVSDALGEVHEALASTMLAIVVAHLSVVALASMLRRRNLAAPMASGRVDGSGADVGRSDRKALAVLLVVATLALDAWSLWSL
jgi:cytochrome b